MSSIKMIKVLKPQDPFRDWLVKAAGDRVRNPHCDVVVSRIKPASHWVCKYDFVGSNYAVVAKFFARPTGTVKDYDPVRAMENEYKLLKYVSRIIPIPLPIARNKEFGCVLLTEYVRGKKLSRILKKNHQQYRYFTIIAHLHRQLHDLTPGKYNKMREFSTFHGVLDQLILGHSQREKFDRLLGKWWHSSLLDRDHGCAIHRDATLANYLFHNGLAYAVDFESAWKHAHPVHDLGIFCAELRHFYAINEDNADIAEPFIGHYLWHYSKDERDFYYVTRTLPFFMSLGYLRIARLKWEPDYRDWLLKEALVCLHSKV